jgi:5'-deoxynucleotidase YfbR-like HD superfamily hydrolase
MKQRDFRVVLNDRIRDTISTLDKKGQEYSSNADKLENFHNAAKIWQIIDPSLSDKKAAKYALAGMLTKHLVSLLDFVAERKPLTESAINEKCGDTVCYTVLLEALLKSELVKEVTDVRESHTSE